MSTWKLYDDLIYGIEKDIVCTSCNTGYYWTSVKTGENGMGLALTIPEFNSPLTLKSGIAGTPLRRLAELSKSWNFIEAAIGVAAISAYYNHPARAFNCGSAHPETRGGKLNAFDIYQNEVRGLKVAVIGRFPVLERRFRDICDLTVFERQPQPGDVSDTACEYLLQEQDYVFLTGITLVNKTMPRILELSENAKVILTGPSTILSPVLFEYGIFCLSGLVVRDALLCENLLREANPMSIFGTGEMVDRVR